MAKRARRTIGNEGKKSELAATRRKTLETTKRLLDSGEPTPLEVMIANMKFYDEEAGKLMQKLLTTKNGEPGPDGKPIKKTTKQVKEELQMLKAISGLRSNAQECARDAAPYMHSKLQSVSLGNKEDKPFKIIVVGDDVEIGPDA